LGRYAQSGRGSIRKVWIAIATARTQPLAKGYGQTMTRLSSFELTCSYEGDGGFVMARSVSQPKAGVRLSPMRAISVECDAPFAFRDRSRKFLGEAKHHAHG
jgi:hypothetical protein